MTDLQIELNNSENKEVESLSNKKTVLFQTKKGNSLRFIMTERGDFDTRDFIFYTDAENIADKTNGDDKILMKKVRKARKNVMLLINKKIKQK